MSFGADLTACAAMVERADPLRFRAAMAAPVAARRVLFPLYAFNVEVARAPWVTQEPMIAEMRLQWWRDALEEIAKGGTVRRHEVTTPLAEAITPEDAVLLDETVASRRWDVFRDAFEDAGHFAEYIDRTSGHLAVVAARRLGKATEEVVRDAAWAAGLAAFLRAVPELEAAGRVPLVDGRPEAVAALAREGLERLARARARRGDVSRAAGAALLHVGAARPVLRAAMAEPVRVADGTLPDPAITDRRHLAWRALSGRW
jgi:15-cis-phytoene synthase